MEISDYLERIDVEGEALLAAAEQAGFDAPVSCCPDWTARDVVTHIGGVHRWAADLIGNARTEFGSEAAGAVGTGPGDEELLEWARAGRGQVITALSAAPADLTCFTMWPADDAVQFWARRQAHETAIHRADADAAAGLTSSYPDAFATDGIAEMLHGFARRKKEYAPSEIRLDGGTATWQISMGATGISAGPVDDSTVPPDVTVAGSASDLYLWLWNRPTAVTTTGDAESAARWEQIRVRWS
jgi:uncharacterized protein (TIGR03083 family)